MSAEILMSHCETLMLHRETTMSHCETLMLHRETSMSHCKAIMLNRGAIMNNGAITKSYCVDSTGMLFLAYSCAKRNE